MTRGRLRDYTVRAINSPLYNTSTCQSFDCRRLEARKMLSFRYTFPTAVISFCYNMIRDRTMDSCHTQSNNILEFVAMFIFQGLNVSYVPLNSWHLSLDGNVMQMIANGSAAILPAIRPISPGSRAKHFPASLVRAT